MQKSGTTLIEEILEQLPYVRMNRSPLRNFKDVTFVMDSVQLEEAIVKFISGKVYTASQRAIFELSEQLPLWKNLLFKTIKN